MYSNLLGGNKKMNKSRYVLLVELDLVRGGLIEFWWRGPMGRRRLGRRWMGRWWWRLVIIHNSNNFSWAIHYRYVLLCSQSKIPTLENKNAAANAKLEDSFADGTSTLRFTVFLLLWPFYIISGHTGLGQIPQFGILSKDSPMRNSAGTSMMVEEV